MERDDFDGAELIIFDAPIKDKEGEEMRSRLREAAAPLIKDKVSYLVQNKDSHNLIKAFHSFGDSFPTVENMPQVSDEVRSPEIQNAIKENLALFVGENPERYVDYRDRWARCGFINAKEMDNSSEIENAIKDELQYWHGRSTYESRKNTMLELKIINEKKIKSLNLN